MILFPIAELYGSHNVEIVFPPSPGESLIPENERGRACRIEMSELASMIGMPMPEGEILLPRHGILRPNGPRDARLVSVPPTVDVRDVVRLPDGSAAILAYWMRRETRLQIENENEGYFPLVLIAVPSPDATLAWWHGRHEAAVVENGLDGDSVARAREAVLNPHRLTAFDILARTAAFQRRLEQRAAQVLIDAKLDDASIDAKREALRTPCSLTAE